MVFTLALLSSFALAAKPEPPRETIEAADVMRVLQEEGHEPELKADSAGDPMIIATDEGTRYIVMFYDCTLHRACKALQLRVYYDVSFLFPLAPLNEWNRTKLYGRAYLDQDGDPTLETLVRLHGGVTLAHLRDEHAWFLRGVSEFAALVTEHTPIVAPAVAPEAVAP